MYRSWHSLIEPLLTIIKPRIVVEIGCSDGKNTKNLLVFAAAHDAVIHAIDPAPAFDPATWEASCKKRLVLHRELSIHALPRLPVPDAVLIDGDHNWHTVTEEFRLLDELTIDRPFPVVFLHDTSWPYARRDMYYDPATIPPDRRQPYAQSGLVPHADELLPHGMNAELHNALHEGGPRNGVLTAVEDFLRQSTRPLRHVAVPGLYGLSIIIDESLLQRSPDVASFFGQLFSAPLLAHLRSTEEHRLAAESALVRHRFHMKEDSLEQDHLVLSNTLRLVLQEHHVLLRKYAAQEIALNRIHRSRSMRITAPLRIVHEKLKKIRKLL